MLQDDDGTSSDAFDLRGTDYAAIGPEHAWLRAIGRADTLTPPTRTRSRHSSCSAARRDLRRSSRRTPWRSHGAWRGPGPDDVLLVNLSGRGDKDVQTVEKCLAADRHVRTAAPRQRPGLVTYRRPGIRRVAIGRNPQGRSIARAPTSSRWGFRSPTRWLMVPSFNAPRSARSRPAEPEDVAQDHRRRPAARPAPIVVFSYANPLLRLGTRELARQAASAGWTACWPSICPSKRPVNFARPWRPRELIRSSP